MTETTAAVAAPDAPDQCVCWPEPERLGEFLKRARAGEHGVPVVGDGSPDTQIGCAHGRWRLGDLIGDVKPTCTEATKAGDPCKGTPGPDGLCAAHKAAAAKE
jgi:hypothetical protein